MCVRFMADDELEDEETYAGYARQNLAQRVMEAPSLYLAQSLVMISFYEWGTGRPYQAWMYSGIFPNGIKLPFLAIRTGADISRHGHLYDSITSQNGR